jgi:hypothetical protein
MQDPSVPTRLLPSYNSGDGLHPNAAGSRRLGLAILDGLLHPVAPVPTTTTKPPTPGPTATTTAPAPTPTTPAPSVSPSVMPSVAVVG